MMFRNSNASILMLLFLVGITFVAGNYLDYDDQSGNRNSENLQAFFPVIVRRMELAARDVMDMKAQKHLIRKSQRAPSRRLRFGRSDPAISAGILPRLSSQQEAFEDN